MTTLEDSDDILARLPAESGLFNARIDAIGPPLGEEPDLLIRHLEASERAARMSGLPRTEAKKSDLTNHIVDRSTFLPLVLLAPTRCS